ncbi:hypothetical protein ACCO45_010014 [Purpureocillium lilacinum]|uniref:Uncharacterized protein n=1 Tax=Purpureocillium lilacinum TaxID=33203 RepID=A0ACC4DDN6_PURLI
MTIVEFFFALPLISHHPRAGLALNGVWTTLSLTFLGWACWQLVTSGVEALWAMPCLSHAAVLFLAVHLSFTLPVGEDATRWDIRLVSLAVLAAFISASSLALFVCMRALDFHDDVCYGAGPGEEAVPSQIIGRNARCTYNSAPPSQLHDPGAQVSGQQQRSSIQAVPNLTPHGPTSAEPDLRSGAGQDRSQQCAQDQLAAINDTGLSGILTTCRQPLREDRRRVSRCHGSRLRLSLRCPDYRWRMMQRAKRQSDEFFTMLSCLTALSSAHLAKTPPVRGKLPDPIHDFAILHYDPDTIKFAKVDGLQLRPDLARGFDPHRPLLVISLTTG